jgi:cellulose synthase/poly-beta-1,6-N-acetylglucosamine synthase-like glycosyltransferase
LIEVLLIDDGSKDGTAKRILNFLESNSTLTNLQFNYFRKQNEGLSIARNFGIRKSNSSIVAFIDEDAIAEENFSTNIIKLFSKNPGVNCIGGAVELSNTDNSFAKIIHYSIFSFQMKSENAIIGTNMSFRKSLFHEVGGFQPEFTYRGDESAFLRKANGKIKILKSENVIVKHPQPQNLFIWLKTRFQNGYFSSAVYDLEKINNKFRFKRLLFSLFTLFYPMLIICGFAFSNNVVLNLSLLVLYLLFFVNRFLFSKALTNLLNEYYKNTNRNILIVPYICFIVILGSIAEDYGDFRGFIKYKNFKWQK